MWVCVTREWEVRSEALLRREVSLILSRSSELLKTTDTWTVPTRRATFIFSLWSFYFSYLCFIHERILLENYMCVFWLKHSIRRLVCVSEVMGEINNSCCFQQRMASMLFSSSFFIIIFWFFDFFGNWPNTLRCRQRVAWEWARATKKVRGYATFCNLNHTCPLTKVFGNSHLLILKFAVLSFLQSILVE